MQDGKGVTVKIKAGEAVSEPIRILSGTKLAVHMPGTWTAANIGFKARNFPGDEYQGVYEQDGSILEISSPVADRVYLADIGGTRYIKLWSQNGSGVDVAQAAERIIGVSVKQES